MQIRVANRQDEPAIRDIVSEALAEHRQVLDPTGADSDLNDVESHYIWHDGIFLVAEEDNRIIGLLGARRADDESIMEIRRLAVTTSHRLKSVARALIDTSLFFARNLPYAVVVIDPRRHHLDPQRPFSPFKQTSPSQWRVELRP